MLRGEARAASRLAVVTTTAAASTTDSRTAAPAYAYVPPPFATEGGSVPVYSTLHGRIQRRNWVSRNPEWCDLCSEPVAQWLNHIGRKDHALMDFHYTQLVQFPRRWNPQDLIHAFQEHLGVDSIEPFHSNFSHEDQHGRNEVHAMLRKLEEAGMLYFGEAKDTYLHMMMGGLRGMDHQGALVMHECLFAPFAHLYPDAHIQDYSNLLDFITCSYNMEAVYDLCGMYTLDTVALKAQFGPSSPAAMGLGGIATSSSASFGYKNESDAIAAAAAAAASPPEAAADASTPVKARQAQMMAAKAERDRENLEEETFSRKAAFMRQVLGQLRWLLSPEQVHPAGYTFPEHIITLGELCLKALMVQTVATRVVEYMVRAEPVWHNFGFERRKLNMKEVVSKGADILPRPFTYTHRSVLPTIEELYSTHSDALDDFVVKGLTKKRVPVPQAYVTHRGVPPAKQ